MLNGIFRLCYVVCESVADGTFEYFDTTGFIADTGIDDYGDDDTIGW